MLSMRWNRFPVCSACDKVSSPYAQCATNSFRVCSAWIVHVNMFTFYRWLSMRGNSFLVCLACGEIGSPYAQHAIKSCYNFRKWLKYPYLKCRFRLQKIQILKNLLGTYLIGPKWRFWKTKFLDISQKNLVPRILSHRGRTSKFWRKSKENKRIFFRKFTKGI